MREWSERHIRDLVHSEWIKMGGCGGGSGGYEWGTGTDKDLLFIMIKEKFGDVDSLGRPYGAIKNLTFNGSVYDPETYEYQPDIHMSVRITDCKPVEYMGMYVQPWYKIGWDYEGYIDVSTNTAYPDNTKIGIVKRYHTLSYIGNYTPFGRLEFGEQLIRALFLDGGGTDGIESYINVDLGMLLADKWTDEWGDWNVFGSPPFGITTDTGEYFGFDHGGLWGDDYVMTVRNSKPISGKRTFSGSISGRITTPTAGALSAHLGPAE